MASKDFPAWHYGPGGQSKLVRNQEELDALPGDWSDTPAAFETEEDAQARAPVEEAGSSAAFVESPRQALDTLPSGHTHRDRLEAQARSLGVKFSRGTSIEELQERIFKAGSD